MNNDNRIETIAKLAYQPDALTHLYKVLLELAQKVSVNFTSETPNIVEARKDVTEMFLSLAVIDAILTASNTTNDIPF